MRAWDGEGEVGVGGVADDVAGYACCRRIMLTCVLRRCCYYGSGCHGYFCVKASSDVKYVPMLLPSSG